MHQGIYVQKHIYIIICIHLCYALFFSGVARGGGPKGHGPSQTGKSGGQTIIWPPPFEVYKIFFFQVYIMHYYLLCT